MRKDNKILRYCEECLKWYVVEYKMKGIKNTKGK